MITQAMGGNGGGVVVLVGGYSTIFWALSLQRLSKLINLFEVFNKCSYIMRACLKPVNIILWQTCYTDRWRERVIPGRFILHVSISSDAAKTITNNWYPPIIITQQRHVIDSTTLVEHHAEFIKQTLQTWTLSAPLSLFLSLSLCEQPSEHISSSLLTHHLID